MRVIRYSFQNSDKMKFLHQILRGFAENWPAKHISPAIVLSWGTIYDSNGLKLNATDRTDKVL
jgi:hypothetical protein